MELTPGHRKYREFLDKHGISKAAAARAIAVTHSAVHGYLDGTSSPTSDRRKAIEVWTGGEVPEVDWMTEKEREIAEKLAAVEPFVPAPVEEPSKDPAA